MDHQNNLQDVIRCDLCDEPVPPLHCDFCHKNLCSACVRRHLLDGSTQHKVVLFEQRGSTILCTSHSRISELHCQQCNIPLCAQCISSATHELHPKNDILETPAPPFDTPKIIKEINIGDARIREVSSLSDNEFWACDREKNIRLFNIEGDLLNLTTTVSGNSASDITVTRKGELVYSNHNDMSLTVVKDTHVQAHIRFHEWRPRAICSTSSDDLLVFMISVDYQDTKIVRYSRFVENDSCFVEKQNIPSGDQRLFSSDPLKYICENKNLDICASDNRARAVVVVKEDGSLRFRYNGLNNGTMNPFYFVGIATDSNGRILTADTNNHCIHILNQNGYFLHYIDNLNLLAPWGLCIDSKDNLLVVVYGLREVPPNASDSRRDRSFKHKVIKVQYYTNFDGTM